MAVWSLAKQDDREKLPYVTPQIEVALIGEDVLVESWTIDVRSLDDPETPVV